MRYIALEVAYSIPEVAERQPPAWTGRAGSTVRWWRSGRASCGTSASTGCRRWTRRASKSRCCRSPSPGLQADIDAATAREDVRFANDYLARVVAEHPGRFRGFAAPPMADPAAAAAEMDRAVRELALADGARK